MTNASKAGGEAFLIFPRIEDARRFVDVLGFRLGEIVVPAGSPLTRVEIWSGPASCSDPAQFSPKIADGKPIVLDVQAGQSVTLPPACFAAHSLAFVGDAKAPITLRLRGG